MQVEHSQPLDTSRHVTKKLTTALSTNQVRSPLHDRCLWRRQ